MEKGRAEQKDVGDGCTVGRIECREEGDAGMGVL